MESDATKSQTSSLQSNPPQRSLKSGALFFVSGAGAGLIAFAVFGGIWQVNHFWWVMVAVSLLSGGLALVFRKNFRAMLSVLLDDAPSI